MLGCRRTFLRVGDPTAWVALVTLIVLEVVLGIDNLIFISILTSKLPEENRGDGRRLNIGAALIMRLLLWRPSHHRSPHRAAVRLFGHPFSWRDLILIAGGLFLVWKATKEKSITQSTRLTPRTRCLARKVLIAGRAVFQILLLDLVFSIDSIITAVGTTDELALMYIAVIVAVITMLIAVNPLSRFIEQNPTIVMLALGFL